MFWRLKFDYIDDDGIQGTEEYFFESYEEALAFIAYKFKENLNIASMSLDLRFFATFKKEVVLNQKEV